MFFKHNYVIVSGKSTVRISESSDMQDGGQLIKVSSIPRLLLCSVQSRYVQFLELCSVRYCSVYFNCSFVVSDYFSTKGDKM